MEAPLTSLIMFSGGRDSSLAACLEASAGAPINLMTGKSGGTIDSAPIVRIRVDEIRSAFPDIQITWVSRPCHGIFRRVALADIEADFAKYRTNLILLGHQLALQAEALVACAELGSSRIVSGFSAYQSPEFMEQRPEAIGFFSDLCEEFDVEFTTPVSSFMSEDAVKYRLLEFGVTTKSLEAVSLFADTFSSPSTDAVLSYLEQKAPIAREYVELRTSRFR